MVQIDIFDIINGGYMPRISAHSGTIIIFFLQAQRIGDGDAVIFKHYPNRRRIGFRAVINTISGFSIKSPGSPGVADTGKINILIISKGGPVTAHVGAWGPVWPTTWGWARRCRPWP
jgi:hypothetical protein